MAGCGKEFQPAGVSMITFICGKDGAFCPSCKAKEDKFGEDVIVLEGEE